MAFLRTGTGGSGIVYARQICLPLKRFRATIEPRNVQHSYDGSPPASSSSAVAEAKMRLPCVLGVAVIRASG